MKGAVRYAEIDSLYSILNAVKFKELILCMDNTRFISMLKTRKYLSEYNLKGIQIEIRFGYSK